MNKQAAEAYFSQERGQNFLQQIIFNNNILLSFLCQKHFGLVLDSRVSFNEEIDQKNT